MLIAAILARKSTDQNGVADQARSVTRQVLHARQYAKQHGWLVGEDYIYVDDGVSGAEFAKRPGFVRLMNALKPEPPFQVLIMSEESRLGRESIEVSFALKQLVQANVRVFCYLTDTERTLDSAMDKAMLSLQTMADEMEREKARQRTYDALARKARAGHVTGGSVFGYDNVVVEVPGPDGALYRSHVERRINHREAEVVRRIFLLNGQQDFGCTRITKFLNAERALAPRPQQGRPSGWSPSSVREVLRRDLYQGLVVWNRTKKRDKWGAAKRTSRPRQEWTEVRVEELRIVSQELWEAVKRRRESMSRRSLRSSGGRLLGRPPGAGAKYLLAGLTKCSKCGASMEARSRKHGRRRVVFYGCSAYHRKGKTVCANTLTVRADVLEDAVLRAVEEVVLDASVVQAAIDKAANSLVGDCGKQKQVELGKEINRIDAELQRLATAVAEGGESSTLMAEIHKRETRRDELHQRMKVFSLQEFKALRSKPRVRRDLERRIQDWRGLLRRRATQGQQILRKLIDGRLLLTPHADETHAYYEFEGTGTITGLLAGIIPHKWALSVPSWNRLHGWLQEMDLLRKAA